jgi:hypothetical protein
MPKQGDQGLRARVDALMLATESEVSAVIQKRPGREFTQDGFRQDQRQACIASCDRMTDLIALAGVEEKYVVRIGYRLISADVPPVNAAIGEHEMRGRGAFFDAAMAARTRAADVSQRYGIRIQQMVDFELGWGGHTDVNILLI